MSPLLELKQKLLGDVPKFSKQVESIYQFLRWEWCLCPNKYECPSLEQIEQVCAKLINGVFSRFDETTTFRIEKSGGIKVEIWCEQGCYWEGRLCLEVAEFTEAV